MYIKLRNNEQVIIETDREKVKVSSDWHGMMSLDGNTKFIRIDDIEFEKALTEIGKKVKKEYKNEERLEEIINLIRKYVTDLSNYLHLDKTVILLALERKRDYSFINYYQKCKLPSITTITELRKEINALNQELFDLKRSHRGEIIRYQKRITDAKGLKVKKVEVETTIDYSCDVTVNCPYCDKWQEIDISDWDHDNGFETNHECTSCGKIFSVKAEK